MYTILVTGGTGLVGKAVEKISEEFADFKFHFIGSRDADLSSLSETQDLFRRVSPSHVIHLAACVGGLFKNMNQKVEMLEKNLQINYNVVKCCYEYDVTKLVACLSTCIFPDKTTYPINETMLHDGPPHDSNDAYAYAKRMLDIHCKAYRENYGCDFQCIIPTNIYGPHDNFHLEDAHVIPALIHKCYLAKKNGVPFQMRGTGKPLRQFIYSEDLARLLMWSIKHSQHATIILSVPEKDEVSIEHVARLIAREYDYEDQLVFDTSFADGQFKKTADNSLLMSETKFNFTPIETGINKSVGWFVENYDKARK
jgi:GDP-L-fucose synthase